MSKHSLANTLVDNTRQKLAFWKELMNEVNNSIEDPLLTGFLGIIERCSSAHQECKNCARARRRGCLDFWDEIA